MNESIYTCASSLCCSLIICSIIRMFAPTGNTSRILSVVMSVFVLLCILTPFLSLSDELNISAKEGTLTVNEKDFSLKLDEEVIKQTANNINSYVNTLLTQSGVENTIIQTILALDENNSIYIRAMNIYLNVNYKERKDEIKALVLRSLGIEPTVTEYEYDQ